MTDTKDIAADLRALASWIEARSFDSIPFSFYGMKKIEISKYFYSLDEFKAVARTLGSFRKEYNGDYFRIVVSMGPTIDIVFYCDRDKVCKRTVTYDCQDAESILLDLGKDVSGQVVEKIVFAVNQDEVPF